MSCESPKLPQDFCGPLGDPRALRSCVPLTELTWWGVRLPTAECFLSSAPHRARWAKQPGPQHATPLPSPEASTGSGAVRSGNGPTTQPAKSRSPIFSDPRFRKDLQPYQPTTPSPQTESQRHSISCTRLHSLYMEKPRLSVHSSGETSPHTVTSWWRSRPASPVGPALPRGLSNTAATSSY